MNDCNVIKDGDRNQEHSIIRYLLALSMNWYSVNLKEDLDWSVNVYCKLKGNKNSNFFQNIVDMLSGEKKNTI